MIGQSQQLGIRGINQEKSTTLQSVTDLAKVLRSKYHAGQESGVHATLIVNAIRESCLLNEKNLTTTLKNISPKLVERLVQLASRAEVAALYCHEQHPVPEANTRVGKFICTLLRKELGSDFQRRERRAASIKLKEAVLLFLSAATECGIEYEVRCGFGVEKV